MKNCLKFRDEDLCSLNYDEDRKHCIRINEIWEKILKNVSEQNNRYVKVQLALLNENFLDYIEYWNEKYYRNVFFDGMQLIIGCVE